MIVVVTYDISDNHRRQDVSAVLEACGARVQLSVFECQIPSAETLAVVLASVSGIIDEHDDQVRAYVLGGSTTDATILGNRRLQERQAFWIL
jgi:CRISPR-associated protein Cas2